MSDAEKPGEREQVWKLLSEAGLVDIGPADFPERIKEAKDRVLRRLTKLLETTSDLDECESAAYSLGTLTELQTRLRAPLSAEPIRSEKPNE